MIREDHAFNKKFPVLEKKKEMAGVGGKGTAAGALQNRQFWTIIFKVTFLLQVG